MQLLSSTAYYLIFRSNFRNYMGYIHPWLIKKQKNNRSMGKCSLYIWFPINTKRETDTIFKKELTSDVTYSFCAKTFQCTLVILGLAFSLDWCSIWIKKQIVRDGFRFSKSSSDLKDKCFTVLSSNNLIWLLLWNPGIQH